MNLYKISQDVNNEYNTYDGAIVAAESEEEARKIHPASGYNTTGYSNKWDENTWCNISDVDVKLIGTSTDCIEKGVILASFNAE